MKRTIPPQIRTSLHQVVQYLYDDEKAHFEESAPGDRQGHIFKALDHLRRWLEEEVESSKCSSRTSTPGTPKG
jgi:hypothetical protein